MPDSIVAVFIINYAYRLILFTASIHPTCEYLTTQYELSLLENA